jgi:hypothetical protein
MNATKRASRFVTAPKRANMTASDELPPIDDEITVAAKIMLGYKVGRDGIESLWRIAWIQRHLPLTSFVPNMRRLVAIARERAQRGQPQ